MNWSESFTGSLALSRTAPQTTWDMMMQIRQRVDAVPSAERRMVLAPNPSQYLVHLSSGTLRAIASGSERFRCGRPRTPNYVRPRESTSSPYPFCLMCQRAQDAGQDAVSEG